MLGFLNVDKPAGLPSRHAVDRVERYVSPIKAGHAGTLDPLATGVLVIAVGPVTRLISRVQDLPKVYRTEFLLGRTSPTDDPEGEVAVADAKPEFDRSTIERALQSFVGAVHQVPPAYSAVHVAGQRAYKLARKGKSVALRPRTVQIDRIELLDWQSPRLTVEIECGSGTYIRSIARDLGASLGCGGLMASLRRLRVGPFHVESAVALDELNLERIRQRLVPPAAAMAHLPRIVVGSEEEERICRGALLRRNTAPETGGEHAVVNAAGELLAVATFRAESREWKPNVVLQPRWGPPPDVRDWAASGREPAM